MTNDILERLSALETNTIFDALDFLELQGATYGLRPLWDCPKIVGRASTILLGPKAEGSPPTVHLITPVIDSITADDRVLVIAGGVEGISSWGDIIANASKVEGIRGTIIDGMSRDIDGSRDIGYPVFGRGVTMISARNRLCIQELRSKAKFFEKTHLVPTLDASASIVKSDNYIDQSLHEELQAAFAKLKLEQKDDPDWHPRSNDMVQNLVHPSLFPLVYGRSRVFREEVVGVEDAIDRWSGKGEVIPKYQKPSSDKQRYYGTGIGGDQVDDSYWSENYQWLPSNVAFQEDGSVKFTSYINGLHPIKHREIYGTIEKLMEKALPAWDFCLACRRDHRMVGSCRIQPRFGMPDNPDDNNDANWTVALEDVPIRAKDESSDESMNDDERQFEDWKKIREPIQPEAPEFKAWDYGTKPGESLRERFRDIQVIVKMASIELTPDKPSFPAGG
ncbi:unnamed protein product [Fusarium graminearum]|uniref:DUF4246 domain-containing protein n=1 Tax=Gibberella zeae TaxID=5518 RepID=A0A9N8NFY5_GIBZA|nr:unnamed protein product [Fusarium graminearum]